MADALPQGFDGEIAAYYARAPEETRLLHGPARLEFQRTCELIERHAPAAPAVALDVGGGSGPYARWLADRGYEVHLVDPIPRLVEEARRASSRAARPLASCRTGDARRLEQPDGSVDLILLLGPLYHLPDPEDRARALAEAGRVLRPGGYLFAAGISRFASALDGLVRDLLGEAEFVAILERDLASGQHRNRTDRVDWFTTAYFHHPHELEREVLEAGYVLDGLYAIEGPAWLLQDFEDRWADPAERATLLDIVRALEREPTLFGVSAHLLSVAHRGP